MEQTGPTLGIPMPAPTHIPLIPSFPLPFIYILHHLFRPPPCFYSHTCPHHLLYIVPSVPSLPFTPAPATIVCVPCCCVCPFSDIPFTFPCPTFLGHCSWYFVCAGILFITTQPSHTVRSPFVVTIDTTCHLCHSNPTQSHTHVTFCCSLGQLVWVWWLGPYHFICIPFVSLLPFVLVDTVGWL